MSFFQLDWECSYQEYMKMIYHHATNYVPPRVSQERHLITCRELLNEAQRECKGGKYDLSFFHYLRCVEILTKVGIPSTYKDSMVLKKQCMDAIEALMNGALKNHYEKMVEELNSKKEGVDVLSVGDPSVVNVNNEEAEHLKRREVLLKNERGTLDSWRGEIGETRIPYNQIYNTTVDYQYWNRDVAATVASDGVVVPPRSIPCASPNAYCKWTYNSSFQGKWNPRRGMVNLGNTCYLNSVVQTLVSTPLGAYFLGDKYTLDVSTAGRQTCRLVNSFTFIVRELNRRDCAAPVSPSPFKKAMGEVNEAFSGFGQQDANEFLRVLLEGIHDGLNDRRTVKAVPSDADTIEFSDAELAKRHWEQYTQQNNSVVVDNCAFQERSSIMCLVCRRISRSFTCSLGIDVPIPAGTGNICLEDCFRLYCKEEELDLDSAYHCPSCKQKVKVSKQLLLYSLPTLLFVTIKRFRSDGAISMKLNDPVFFQKKIDLKPFLCSTEKNTIYDLVGVVNHSGSTTGGHYTADYYDNHCGWSSASDERVSRADKPDYRLVYILCYVRSA
ncbi:ubiquitin carboxyl-terminal hydrolase, putative [Trypanosoma brucei brucei TREU927]|uniref:Ubiquitin carboxyl-terminal hydrolase n=1 Tax=Trypanosoma brucei brucei (strain 927/4 GUTat10.1) TaxID=185431 RepID=Q386W6_TRYB2|nr:ubiquitin carboxyl-terminal hydrolase, putative [Trypanosoma brucei brucei TREU927]EAN79165.1 ubiquitin carboxyl-terminal hydrolase, putative [Trypanosoma brucei brucei TREU927]